MSENDHFLYRYNLKQRFILAIMLNHLKHKLLFFHQFIEFSFLFQVLSKAGGSGSTVLFTQATANPQSHRGPHRGLQMCAFQIGLYALGLHNRVSPNWLSRTYSSHNSWIASKQKSILLCQKQFLVKIISSDSNDTSLISLCLVKLCQNSHEWHWNC